MNNEFFAALELLAKENNIETEQLIENIKQGIMKAAKRDYPDSDNIGIEINPEKGKFDVRIIKTVVDGVPENPGNEKPVGQLPCEEKADHAEQAAFVCPGGVH